MMCPLYTGTDMGIMSTFVNCDRALNLLKGLRETYLADYKKNPSEKKRGNYLIHDNLVIQTDKALKLLASK